MVVAVARSFLNAGNPKLFFAAIRVTIFFSSKLSRIIFGDEWSSVKYDKWCEIMAQSSNYRLCYESKAKLFRIYYAWKLARKSQSGMIIIIIWLTSTTMTRIEN